MSLIPSFFNGRRSNIFDPFLVVRISGERKTEKEDKNDTWHRVECSNGKFLRSFRLPENAKMDQIKAAMENGVLTVTVPKVEAKKPDVKAIEISGRYFVDHLSLNL
ncbi:class i heat shock protein [Quercus suber]|uniref:Class i heat shock protein n=1 Tax=Quercus suber TaxID=58331 RepID=A0AAW0LFR6_QUESU